MTEQAQLSKTMALILDAFDRIWERKGAFFSVFFAILLVTYGVLFAIDFIPEAPGGEDKDTVTENMPRANQAVTVSDATPEPELPPVAPLPTRLTIEELGTDVAVLNPESRDIAELDEALLEGVVRHPDSADFGDEGTMVLFGHSSYLPTVHNKNFQAFNGIQNLEWGDTVTLESDDMEYIYRVKKVYKAKASQASVELDHDNAKLILVTCDSFGSKDDRFVVEAELIDTKAL